MSRTNTARQEPLPIAPSQEESTAAFVRCSRAKAALEAATSHKKIATEEFASAFESLMLIGRRFELAQSGADVAVATKDYVEQQSAGERPGMALVPVQDGEYAVVEG